MSGTEAHADRQEDYRFLHSMLMEKKLHLLFKIHERLKRFEKRSPIPARDHASALVSDLLAELSCDELSCDELSRDPGVHITELLSLLSGPRFTSLLWAHDAVARQQFQPRLPPFPEGVPGRGEDGDSVKIVRLVKTGAPLGATIRRDRSTGAILVARILKGGAADKSGLIHEGDELREVNGVSLESKTPEEILPLLASSQQEVKLKVIPADVSSEQPANKKKLFVRALFDYDPKDDPAVPCREAALTFRRGDVLQVLSKEDDTWWQARRHGDDDTWAGLIPSQQLHERRVTLQRPEALFKPQDVQPRVKEDVDYGAISGIRVAGQRRSFRLGRRGGRLTEAQTRRRSAGLEALARAPAYVEVVPYRRGPKDRQLLVLLVDTSRERKKQEQDGVDYYFVSQRKFEEDVLNHRFMEYGMYRGHYYGTSLDSVADVMAEGKVCLADVHPGTIESVYTAEFQPYVVFVKPPRVEELRLTRRRATFICTTEEDQRPARMFSEEDFEDMIGSADATETERGHMFDKVVVNGDVATAFRELRAALEKASGPDLRWIPAAWIQNLAC